MHPVVLRVPAVVLAVRALARGVELLVHPLRILLQPADGNLARAASPVGALDALVQARRRRPLRLLVLAQLVLPRFDSRVHEFRDLGQ